MSQLPLTCGISAVHVGPFALVSNTNGLKRTETNLKTPKHSLDKMQLEEAGFSFTYIAICFHLVLPLNLKLLNRDYKCGGLF